MVFDCVALLCALLCVLYFVVVVVVVLLCRLLCLFCVLFCFFCRGFVSFVCFVCFVCVWFCVGLFLVGVRVLFGLLLVVLFGVLCLGFAIVSGSCLDVTLI